MDTISDAEWSRRTRQSLRLDLGGTTSRRRDPSSDVVLSSPDVRLLKLASPELDRLVLQQFRHHHHHHHQQQHDELLQDSSTDRQMDVTASEEYARGFVDVLLELHAQRHSDCDPTSVTGTSSVQDSSTVSFQTTTSTTGDCEVYFCHDADAGPVASGSDAIESLRETSSKSPQHHHESYAERARLERKRARNRLAASRCRNRKLERIEHLQSHVDRLRATNARLSGEVKQLHETVTQLRHDVLSHVACQPGVSLPPFCF